MSYSLEKIAQLMAFYEGVKKDSFIDFMRKFEALMPPPPPPPSSWAAKASTPPPLQLTNTAGTSDDGCSVGSDEGPGIMVRTRKTKDMDLHMIMSRLPVFKQSAFFVMLRNHYLTCPEMFNRLSEGHYSSGDAHPHIGVRVEIPVYHNESGKTMKLWEHILHFYYTETAGRRSYTEVYSTFEGVPQLIAIHRERA